MIEEFNRKAQIVGKFMDSQKLDFIVVGSGALLMCGMPLSREPHDVDIEVICEQEQIFKALDRANNINKTDYKNSPYVFKIQDVVVNAWVVTEFTHKHVVYHNYIKYATVSSVLQKKMSYQRSKDILDLHDMVSNLMTLDKVSNN